MDTAGFAFLEVWILFSGIRNNKKKSILDLSDMHG